MNKLPRLPIGIQTFSKIREQNDLYVDKTRQIHRLITSGDYFFLSRPRRFGKSVTLSTIESIYRGEREFFDGLWIEDQWDWAQIRPVLHIGFSSIGYGSIGLEEAIEFELRKKATQLGVTLTASGVELLFGELIEKLSVQGKVVILIDEYDKPIIDYFEELDIAKKNQTILRRFYSVIKDNDRHIEFLLITGISKFSKVSIFSVLNNLNDITLNRHYADLTGYTPQEMEANFAPYMLEAEEHLQIDRQELLEKLRHWYNGYTWDGKTYVYNPFSILNFFDESEFRNYWFDTATPTFLLELMRAQQVVELDNLEMDELSFSTYEIERLNVVPILFQTGYLTIKGRTDLGLYKLGYPNAEVRDAMIRYLISDWAHIEPSSAAPTVIQIFRAFESNNVDQIIKIIKSIFKNIPSQIFISKADAYYHSLIYTVFLYLGQYTDSEVNTNNGRLDCVVQTSTHIFILEFNLLQSAEIALKQIKDRGYADKFVTDPRPKVLLGINFSGTDKTVEDWLVETVP